MKTAVIHQTDLFHHYADPDDHYDLACQFALAYSGSIELEGILIDYPPTIDNGDPDICAVNQLNFITGLSVPSAVGTSKKIISDDNVKTGKFKLNSGINMIIDVLEKAEDAVAIHIVGSCRDIAIAGILHPELFRDKCKAIYLNAGTSKTNGKTEYNVELDSYSYSAIFNIPCAVYWMPCFETLTIPYTIGEFGTFYKFRQDIILQELSYGMQNYFNYALGKVTDNRWLKYITEPVNNEMLSLYSNRYRDMWCTGGFLHTAGKTVSVNGDIVPINSCENPVFSFVSIKAECSSEGIVDWQLTDGDSERYIYRINDLQNYQNAMIKALKTLLKELP